MSSELKNGHWNFFFFISGKAEVLFFSSLFQSPAFSFSLLFPFSVLSVPTRFCILLALTLFWSDGRRKKYAPRAVPKRRQLFSISITLPGMRKNDWKKKLLFERNVSNCNLGRNCPPIFSLLCGQLSFSTFMKAFRPSHFPADK